jgi:predicted AlkP superfamily phosphohydrolase/phosphomutase
MPRTLLIGLDGATWEVLDPYMELGLMPALQKLTARGTRAGLASIVPALTPPAWTSLVTGKRPGGHGVFDFFQKEEPDSVYFTFAGSQDVHSSTIWSLAGEAGRRVISLNFPLMFPPPPIDGCVVPGGMMPWRQLRLGCQPAGLFERLKALPGFNPREMLDMELEVKAIEGCPDEEQEAYVEQHIVREHRWMQVARHLMETEDAELVGVMFDGVDKLQHLCWRFIHPASRPAEPTPWEERMIERCEMYFRTVDGIIAELVELAGADATVLIASDHGFGPTSEVFHVNSWLEREGFLTWAPEGGETTGDGTKVGFKDVARHVRALDWSRTLAYAATPSSQGIHVVDGDRDVRDEIAARLRLLRTDEDQPLVTGLWSREEAFPGPYAGIGPDLSFALAGGATMSILPSAQLLVRRPQVRGHHRERGVFVAAGPGIRAGAQVDDLSIVDVAPLVLHRHGLPIVDVLDGRLPEAVHQPAELAARPPRLRAARAVPDTVPAAGVGVELDEAEQAGVIARLKALGYVE